MSNQQQPTAVNLTEHDQRLMNIAGNMHTRAREHRLEAKTSAAVLLARAETLEEAAHDIEKYITRNSIKEAKS